MDEEENNMTKEKMDVETNSDWEFKLWQKIYVGQLSDEESNTSSDLSG